MQEDVAEKRAAMTYLVVAIVVFAVLVVRSGAQDMAYADIETRLSLVSLTPQADAPEPVLCS